MRRAVLTDTGFWIALYDRSERDHAAAVEKAVLLDRLTLVLPWPLVYETLRTRFVRRPAWVARLHQRVRHPEVVFLDDGPYRQRAYDLSVEYATRLNRPVSMVDMLCRLLIEDHNVRIRYMLTFNPRDFADVCGRHRVEFL